MRLLEFEAINGTNIESGSSAVVLNLPHSEAPVRSSPPGVLTETDAVEIWIGRWLRIRRKDLMARFGCDSGRLYEIWWGNRFPASREQAAKLFAERYPARVDRTWFGYRRIPRGRSGTDPRQQPGLFD